MADKALYQVVLYSLHDPVEILASNLDLEQAADYMNKHKQIPHTMIGLWDQPPSDEGVQKE